jgi:hypothetical protein
MSELKERLQAEIERLDEAELRALQKFIADLTLPEDDPLPEEERVLDEVEQSPPDYVPWQRRTPSS